MSSILISLDAGVLTITLNRPDKLNAFNPEMHQRLKAALERARDESEVRAVLLTGAGRGFCAGQDLADVRGVHEEHRVRGEEQRMERDAGEQGHAHAT